MNELYEFEIKTKSIDILLPNRQSNIQFFFSKLHSIIISVLNSMNCLAASNMIFDTITGIRLVHKDRLH